MSSTHATARRGHSKSLAPAEGLSLAACHRRISAEWRPNVGHPPPSLIALKRWSAAGDLDGAKRSHIGRGNEGRVVYALEEIRAVCTVWARKKAEAQARRPLSLRARASTMAGADRAAPSSSPTVSATNNARGAANECAHVPASGKAELTSEAVAAIGMVQAQVEELSARLVAMTDIASSLQAQLKATEARLSHVDDLRHIGLTLMQKYDAENAMLRENARRLSAQVQRLQDEASPIDVAKVNIKLQNILETVQRMQSPG